jgi:hypothetical protein
MREWWMAALLAAGIGTAAGTATAQPVGNPYPTVAVGDYLLGCMAANGDTRQALERCACSIDVIASILPYEAYEAAETFLGVGRIAGERGVIFRTSEQSKESVGALRRAQIEAELRCF